ncbi:hypothetical protein B0H66DRAFT_556128 [Apodospora peruviana]|uniref:Peptide hydrolase n=1 Tax=Apodospora peruviana TaxID=516989 RepID=A0AAE0I458_9PEZI|nr:hypothetical protein B0H66DRAFT_556128 [Apodospora peruviana]
MSWHAPPGHDRPGCSRSSPCYHHFKLPPVRDASAEPKMRSFTTASLATIALVLPVLGDSGPLNKTPGHCQKHLVSSEKLQSQITLKPLRAGAEKLQAIANANGGTRVFGSAGHNATVDYIFDTLTSLGYYDVVKQPFTEIYSAGTGSFAVNGEAIVSNIMTYTPSGSVTAQVIAVPDLGCTPEVYPVEVAGNIALVERGTCNFAAKALSAKMAGAAALVIYNNIEGSISGTLGTPFLDYAPVVSISQADGHAILASLTEGPVTADFEVIATTEERVNYNVLAETKEGDHNNVLVLGAHSDSVAAGAGINDDGSGSIGILEVAKALSKFKIKNAVRFGWWGAEEFGKLGSYYYVESINSTESQLAKIRAYLNFDMIASPNYIYSIYDGDGDAFGLKGPAGSDVIEKDFQDFYAANGFPSVPKPFDGRSDYAAFIENGIPAGGIFTGAEAIKTEEEAALFGGQAGVALDINYHGVGDTVDNLDWTAFLLNTKAIANSVAKYALSFDSLPAVSLDKRRYSGDMARYLKNSRDEHSHGHDHGDSAPCGGEERDLI